MVALLLRVARNSTRVFCFVFRGCSDRRCIHIALLTFDSLPRILTPVGRFIDRPPPPPSVVAIIEYDCTYSFGNLLSLDKHIEGDERSMEFDERQDIQYTRTSLMLAAPKRNPVRDSMLLRSLFFFSKPLLFFICSEASLN